MTMSDREPVENFDTDMLASQIALGASRWMDRGQTDIMAVILRNNEYKTALGNPTKDPNEALAVLYEDIRKTNYFLIDGGREDALGAVDRVVEKVAGKFLSSLDTEVYKRQMAKIKEENKNIKDTNLVVIFSNNMAKCILLDLPKNVKS